MASGNGKKPTQLFQSEVNMAEHSDVEDAIINAAESGQDVAIVGPQFFDIPPALRQALLDCETELNNSPANIRKQGLMRGFMLGQGIADCRVLFNLDTGVYTVTPV